MVAAIMLVLVVLDISRAPTMIIALPLLWFIGVTFSSIALVFNALAKGYDFFTYYFTLVLTPMTFLSGVYFPIDQMPVWLQWVAKVLPLTAAVQIVRRLGSVAQLDAIGRKCLHAAQLLPVLENGGILKEAFHHGLVVAAQAHRAIGDESHREQIEHGSRMRSAINIVAEIDFDRMRDRSAPDVVVDARNDFVQQIGASVDVTDRIDARIRRR